MSRKTFSGWGFAPDPDWGGSYRPPDPLLFRGGGEGRKKGRGSGGEEWEGEGRGRKGRKEEGRGGEGGGICAVVNFP